jgi:hypothetical protein
LEQPKLEGSGSTVLTLFFAGLSVAAEADVERARLLKDMFVFESTLSV